jgi:hypothetical protein
MVTTSPPICSVADLDVDVCLIAAADSLPERVSAVVDLDVEVCVSLAADLRSWLRRAGWHNRSLCRGRGSDVYISELSPSCGDVELCMRCPVRTECAVDGLRQGMDGTLAESRNEIQGCWGGLGPDDLWSLACAMRDLAAERGIAMCDAAQCRGELIDQYYDRGWSAERIAKALGLTHQATVDHLTLSMANRGWSHRRIAAALPRRSYTWYELRLRQLRAARARAAEAA